LLKPGELAPAFAALGLETVSFDEDAKRGTARLLVRRS